MEDSKDGRETADMWDLSKDLPHSWEMSEIFGTWTSLESSNGVNSFSGVCCISFNPSSVRRRITSRFEKS